MPHEGHDHGHDHGHVHTHPRRKFKATVDHLANDYATASKLLVAIDEDLMHQSSLKPDEIVRVATERGRAVLVRLDKPVADDKGRGVVRMDRFLRQALKAHLNETVDVEPAELGPAKIVELNPAIDVSTAHNLVPHLKKVLVENRTPLSIGAVLYIPFPGTQAGTTYDVNRLPDGVGYVTEDTDVRLHFHDEHVPQGTFDVTFEDVGGLGQDASRPRRRQRGRGAVLLHQRPRHHRHLCRRD